MEPTFIHKCANDTLNGLRDGLSRFSGTSTAAVIFNLPGESSLSVFDPDCLLRGHELKLHNHYVEKSSRFSFMSHSGKPGCYSQIEPVPELEIDGLISYGGSSSTVPYQMWFTQHHPDLASTGPTTRWLQHAALRFSHDIANAEDLYTGISGNFLREYATYAIHDHIKEEARRLSSGEDMYDINHVLNTVLAISKTREEGAWPYGELVFLTAASVKDTRFLAKFLPSELPRLNHHKHVRKLLQTVERCNLTLISDGTSLLGISDSHSADFSLTANFQGRLGFLRINENIICSFADGRYMSSTHRAKLYEVEEALLDYDLTGDQRDKLFQILSALVHNAQTMKHGCTFILDLNSTPTKISGQLLQQPLNLNDPKLLQLASAFSKVDGALHICADQRLYGFACLLDGHVLEGEDRARGARYNSALRFTAEKPNTLVVVVSVDRPVSVIEKGMDSHGFCQWSVSSTCSPPPKQLEEWLAIPL